MRNFCQHLISLWLSVSQGKFALFVNLLRQRFFALLKMTKSLSHPFRISCLIAVMLSAPEVQACHQGGPMGFAAHDPGAFSLDITSSTFFPFASTSGTSHCEQWDFVSNERSRFIGTYHESLGEELVQGTGFHLETLISLSGCVSNPVLLQRIQRQTSLIQALMNSDMPLQKFSTDWDYFLKTQAHEFCQIPLNNEPDHLARIPGQPVYFQHH
ncbi:MAG: DUF3015 family protein [SAR324 cluster bacterium]|nr:DUF3015 family protein [SAR324 cluster bacterium]